MKKIFFNINIILILFFSISICLSQEDKLFKKEMKGIIVKLGGDEKERDKSLEKIWEYIGNKEKRIIPSLIEELKNEDSIVVLEIEALLYRITEYNCYGICIGNKKGIKEWEKWWQINEKTFKIHPIDDNYYRYYYTNPKTFVYNMGIYFWRNVKVAGLPIPKYPQDEKPTKELEILIKRLVDRLRDTEDCKIKLVELTLDYIGRPMIPYVIDEIYIEGKDAEGEYLNIGRVGSEFLQLVSGLWDCWQKDKGCEDVFTIPDDSKKAQEWWRNWWGKNQKSFKYIINRYNLDKQEISKKRMDLKITSKIEDEIKSLILKLGSENEKEREWAKADLIQYGKPAVPYLIESFEGASIRRAEDILYTLFFILTTTDPTYVNDPLEVKIEKWKKWWEENKEKFMEEIK